MKDGLLVALVVELDVTDFTDPVDTINVLVEEASHTYL